MLQITYFFMIIVGLIFYKSKIIHYFLIIYIFIVMALNNYNPDYRSYNLIYTNPSIAQEEIGFRFLCKLGNYLGFSYDLFHMVIVSIGLCLFIKGVFIFSKHGKVTPSNFYLVNYMIFPMVFDVILLRSFLASSIIIYALHFLSENKKKLYIIFIFIAASIHISSFFFLLLLIKIKFNYINISSTILKKRKKYIQILSLVGIIFLAIIIRLEVCKEFLILLGGNEVKIKLWLDGSNITLKMIIFCIFINLINYFTYCFIHYNYSKNDHINNIKEINNYVFIINHILLINIILMIYSDQFIRLLGVGIIMNSIYYSILLKKERKKKRCYLIMLLGITTPLILFIYKMFFYTTPNGKLYIEYVFKCILKNNFILDFFN